MQHVLYERLTRHQIKIPAAVSLGDRNADAFCKRLSHDGLDFFHHRRQRRDVDIAPSKPQT